MIAYSVSTETHRLSHNLHSESSSAKSNFGQVGTEYTCGQICMYIEDSPAEIITPNTSGSDGPQQDRPAACVIIQQYSSAIYVRLRFHSSRQKLGARF